VKKGLFQHWIEQSSYEYQKRFEQGEVVVVGVNRFQTEGARETVGELLKIDPEVEREQIERLRAYRRRRNFSETRQALKNLQRAAERGSENLMPYILEALRAQATLGEISDTLREVYGEYQES